MGSAYRETGPTWERATAWWSWDVSNPSSPTVLGKSGALPDIVQGVVVSGNYAYVADGDGGLVVLQLGNPAPTVTGITPGSGLNTGSVGITDLAGTTSGLVTKY